LNLPFTEAEFLDVFKAYNEALWPAVVLFWMVTLAFGVGLIRGRAHTITLNALLALHWAWEGLAYHAAFFSRINPAARLFAVLFVVQALAFVWFGMVRRRVTFDWGWKPRRVVAGVFVAYSLFYPMLVLASGHEYPRAPMFAVPCPTALFTVGLLFAASPPVPRWLFVIPILWSAIGGSAALVLGMTPDLMLFAGAVCLLAYAIQPRLFAGSPSALSI
jgi:uncharacterized protein DUF6064